MSNLWERIGRPSLLFVLRLIHRAMFPWPYFALSGASAGIAVSAIREGENLWAFVACLTSAELLAIGLIAEWATRKFGGPR